MRAFHVPTSERPLSKGTYSSSNLRLYRTAQGRLGEWMCKICTTDGPIVVAHEPERASLASIVHRRATPPTRVVGPPCLKQGAWLACSNGSFPHTIGQSNQPASTSQLREQPGRVHSVNAAKGVTHLFNLLILASNSLFSDTLALHILRP